jgi:hypothetical protein
MKKYTIFTLIIIVLVLTFLTSCGVGEKIKDFHKPVDLRKELA